MDESLYDIAIVGLGPAGATLARLLSKRYRVIALDKRDLISADVGSGVQRVMLRTDKPRKPCGGLIAPDAQKALSRFDLALPHWVLSDPQVFAVKTIDLPRRITRHYQRFYLNVDRERFDRWLVSLIPDRVTVFESCCVREILSSPSGFDIRLEDGRQVSSRYVVGADGAGSMVRKTFFSAPIREYAAIQQWFTDDHPSPFFSALFDEQITDCYAWSSSKGGYFILGAALDRAHPLERFEELKVRLADHGFVFTDPVHTESCRVFRPFSYKSFCTHTQGVFLAGEAAGFISPSSLEGISSALESARLLAESMNRSLERAGTHYPRSTRGLKAKLIGKMLKVPFMYQPHLRSAIMRTGIDSIEVLGDADSRELALSHVPGSGEDPA